jgi:FlaA1/EpsC-like NDP-sugar epimerase
MHWCPEVRKWIFPRSTSKELGIDILHLFHCTIAKNFTLVKIDLKTRELLKSTEQQLKILSLLQVMIQEENSIIGILQDGQTIIYQMRDDTSYLPIGFCSSDKQSKHISHYVK